MDIFWEIKLYFYHSEFAFAFVYSPSSLSGMNLERFMVGINKPHQTNVILYWISKSLSLGNLRTQNKNMLENISADKNRLAVPVCRQRQSNFTSFVPSKNLTPATFCNKQTNTALGCSTIYIFLCLKDPTTLWTAVLMGIYSSGPYGFNKMFSSAEQLI